MGEEEGKKEEEVERKEKEKKKKRKKADRKGWRGSGFDDGAEAEDRGEIGSTGCDTESSRVSWWTDRPGRERAGRGCWPVPRPGTDAVSAGN